MVTIEQGAARPAAGDDAGVVGDQVAEVLRQAPYGEVWQRALPHLQTRHNEIHTQVALACALDLLHAEGGDEDVVVPAILLHDIGWTAVPESLQGEAFGLSVRRPDLQKLHEEEGARMARQILHDLNCPAAAIAEIVHIISRHDTDPVSVSLNDSLVKDADKLWRYTRVGFGIDVVRFRRTEEDLLAAFAGKIEEWFFTATAVCRAREEVKRRKEEMAP